MFRKFAFIFCFTWVLLGLFACSQPANSPSEPGPSPSPAPAKISSITSLSFVKAAATEASVVAGGSGEVIVNVSVQRGYHVNANPATDAYLKATELIVLPADGFSVGFIKYPTALNRKFAFSDKQLAVYEGDFPVKVLLKAVRGASRGRQNLSAKLNVQACDEQLCYPPGTLELTIPVFIK